MITVTVRDKLVARPRTGPSTLRAGALLPPAEHRAAAQRPVIDVTLRNTLVASHDALFLDLESGSAAPAGGAPLRRSRRI
jgi:hypothetical protein